MDWISNHEIVTTLRNYMLQNSTLSDSELKVLQEGIDMVVEDQQIKDPACKDQYCIVLEGLDGTGKSTVLKFLVEKLSSRFGKENVAQIRTPPAEFSPLRKHFDQIEDRKVGKAFYHLGNYLAGYYLRRNSTKYIIMDRFWPSTFAYQEATDSTMKDHSLIISQYKWPNDLYKPFNTFIVQLSLTESLRRKRVNKRSDEENTVWEDHIELDSFRNTVLEAYKKMEGIKIVDSSGTPEETGKNILRIIGLNIL